MLSDSTIWENICWLVHNLFYITVSFQLLSFKIDVSLASCTSRFELNLTKHVK